MDQPWLFVLGIIVVLAALADLVLTTVRVGARRGPVTAVVARAVWRGTLVGRPSHHRRSLAGLAATVAVLLGWVGLLWGGFTLMYLSDADAVMDSSSGMPASGLGRLAYGAGGLAGAGASLLAGGAGWQLVNNVSALIGLTVAALAVTFVLQVVTSVTSERAMASELWGLGPTPADVVETGLRSDVDALRNTLSSVASKLSFAAESHLAFPMLGYFHSGDARTSVPLAIARYDEMLTLLEHAAPGRHAITVRSGRAAVDRFMGTSEFHGAASGPPPVPALGRLAASNDLDREQIERGVASDHVRRARMRALVQQAGWTWDDLHAPGEATEQAR